MSGVAVVSGGGTGIGRAIAAALAADGLEVVIVGRRADVLADTAKSLSDTGRVSWRAADLTVAAEVESLVAGVRSDHGVVDVIVNNAGGNAGGSSDTLADLADSWRAAYELNVVSAALLTYGLLPLLRRPGGRIVTIGSMSSRTGGGAAAYGAAKAALNGWVLALSAEYAPEGITANVVLPGYVPDTGLFDGRPMPPEIHDKIVSRISAGRAGQPQDAAALVRFLASQDAGFVTGQVIEVNGGTVPANK